jgi:hypothetical protein
LGYLITTRPYFLDIPVMLTPIPGDTDPLEQVWFTGSEGLTILQFFS